LKLLPIFWACYILVPCFLILFLVNKSDSIVLEFGPKRIQSCKKKKLMTKFNKYKILNSRSTVKYEMVNSIYMYNVLAISFKF
jgi:hypothetical protein